MAFQKNKLCTAVAFALFGTALAACGGHHHHHGGGGGGDDNTDLWIINEGATEATQVLVRDIPELLDECKVAQGTIIVVDNNDLGDLIQEHHAYVWNKDDGANPIAAWPGDDITDMVVDGCTIKTTRQYNPFEENQPDDPARKTLADYDMIIINGGNGKPQTRDLEGLSQDNACVTVMNYEGQLVGELSSAAECGVHVDGLEDAAVETEVYLYRDGTKLTDGAEIDFTQKDDSTKSVKVIALIKGAGVSKEAKGYYWFNDDEKNKKEFENGSTLDIGSNVEVEDGKTREGELHLQFVETVDEIEFSTKSTFTIKKSYVAKDEEARMKEKEPEETLGAIYTNEKTTFRIWSPDSADVKVNVDGTDYEMKPVQLEGYTKVYEAVVEGDLAGKTYQFSVKGNKVRDPYGRMTAKGSDTANIVMNLDSTDPEDGWITNPAEFKNREDAVVYEVHVRDFTIDPSSGVDEDKRGRYLGMVQEGTAYHGIPTGIDHLKKLGVTHVQLQPIYDYATCSNVDSQDNSCYNWGYDPWNYNVPEDRYTSVFGTDNYEQKIREVKEMINMFHKNGIRVIMDVVYNHTFDKSVFEKITDQYYLGNNDLSGCGNAINADNNMVWMMIRDSLDYWVTEYHVDGFRLDLAGVFGIKDFSDWGKYLNKRHPDANLLIYGEPWTGGGDATAIKDPVRTGRMFMQDPDAHVGAFNNRIRNCLKSASDRSDSEGNTSRLGFIFNQLNTDWDGNGTDENGNALNGNKECVFMSVKAGVRTENAPAEVVDEWSAQGFSDPEQAISYITAHDNLALRDKIERASIDGNVLYNEDEVKTIQAYANSIIMISQGIAFIHGGEELGRTKKAAGESGESPMWNTYKTTSGANDFKWDLLANGWDEVNETYGDYIWMRRAHPAFRMTTAELINENVTLDPASTDEVVIININGEAVNDEWGTIKVVMNSKDTEVDLGDDVVEMTKVADGKNVGNQVADTAKAAPHAVSIWVTANKNVCTATQRYDSLYIVGSFPDSNWQTWIPMERKCEGDVSWWQTKDPVSIPANASFKFTDAADWNHTIIGYSEPNVQLALCTDQEPEDDVEESGVATACLLSALAEGSSTDNINPSTWTQGIATGSSYMMMVGEWDLGLWMSDPDVSEDPTDIWLLK